MIKPNLDFAESSHGKKPVVAKFIGVGGAGSNVTEYLSKMSFDNVEFWVINTDARGLAQCTVKHQYQLGSALTHGFGTGGDFELAWAAAEKEADRLAQICVGADIVFVAAGLGGGTGTGAAPVIARMARESGALVMSLAILPFDCEGAKRTRQAQRGLEELRKASDGVIQLPNQRMFKLINDKTTLLQTVLLANELITSAMRGLWHLISQPGIINVDFSDLCSAIRGHHSESSFASAEASGPDRAREVIEILLNNPLVETGELLAKADTVLISIVAGSNVTMSEINLVADKIHRHSEKAQIILGAAIDESMNNRLEITLFTSIHSPVNSDMKSGVAESSEINTVSGNENLVDVQTGMRTSTRYVPPPPNLTPEQAERHLKQQKGNSRLMKILPRLKQAQLPLEIVSKGRFEKSEPTIHQGEDMDVPTFIRKGVPLN